MPVTPTTTTATIATIALSGTQTMFYLVTATQNGTESLTNSTQTAATAFATAFGTFTSPDTNRVWMDRNLGASQVATGSTDTMAYGDLYQWGRTNSGYQRIDRTIPGNCFNAANAGTSVPCTSLTTNTKAMEIAAPAAGVNFITSLTLRDWLEAGDDDNGALRSAFWGKIDGSSICPTGFRVPTNLELVLDTIHDGTYTGKNDITNTATAFSSFLKLPASGLRSRFKNSPSGNIVFGSVDAGNASYLWGGQPTAPSTSFLIVITATFSRFTNGGLRSNGASVRCIRN